MQRLVEWTNQSFAEKLLHPLLILAVFAVRFLAIHPFQDGNGRLSRILTTLLLLRAGYAYVPDASLESVIEENKDLYYAALRKTQGTLKQAEPKWEAWIIFISALSEKAERQPRRQIETRTNHGAGVAGVAADDSEAIAGTRTLDDFGDGTADGSEPEYAQVAVAGTDASAADFKARTGAGDMVFN